MIIRLAPTQIAEIWDYVRPGIREMLVPTAEVSNETLQKVLRSLLCEDMQLWLGVEDPSDLSAKSIYGFMLTTVYRDPISDTRSLLVYAVYETRDIPNAVWASGLRKLIDFAHVQKCRDVSAYSKIPRMIELCKTLGFELSTFMRKEL